MCVCVCVCVCVRVCVRERETARRRGCKASSPLPPNASPNYITRPPHFPGHGPTLPSLYSPSVPPNQSYSPCTFRRTWLSLKQACGAVPGDNLTQPRILHGRKGAPAIGQGAEHPSLVELRSEAGTMSERVAVTAVGEKVNTTVRTPRMMINALPEPSTSRETA